MEVEKTSDTGSRTRQAGAASGGHRLSHALLKAGTGLSGAPQTRDHPTSHLPGPEPKPHTACPSTAGDEGSARAGLGRTPAGKRTAARSPGHGTKPQQAVSLLRNASCSPPATQTGPFCPNHPAISPKRLLFQALESESSSGWRRNTCKHEGGRAASVTAAAAEALAGCGSGHTGAAAATSAPRPQRRTLDGESSCSGRVPWSETRAQGPASGEWASSAWGPCSPAGRLGGQEWGQLLQGLPPGARGPGTGTGVTLASRSGPAPGQGRRPQWGTALPLRTKARGDKTKTRLFPPCGARAVSAPG